jgi:hypothetical protein
MKRKVLRLIWEENHLKKKNLLALIFEFFGLARERKEEKHETMSIFHNPARSLP